MAIKITSTQKSVKFIKALVYGEPGSGKTVLASTAPGPLIISAEKGLLSLSNLDIPAIEVQTWTEIQEAYNFIVSDSKEMKGIKTICVDSISEIAEIMLSEFGKLTKEDGKTPIHGMQVYGKLGVDGTELIKGFRDIKDKHVYIIAKMSRMVDEYSGITNWAPEMPGNSLKTRLPYAFDLLLPLRIGETEDGEKYRYLQTQADIQYIAKDRSGKLDDMEEAHLGKLFSKILKK